MTTPTCFLLINIPLLPLKLLLSLAGGHAAHALWVVQKWMVREMWSMHVPLNGECAKKKKVCRPVDAEEQSQSGSVPPTLPQIDFLIKVNLFFHVQETQAHIQKRKEKKKPPTRSYKMRSRDTEPWCKCDIPTNGSRALQHCAFFPLPRKRRHTNKSVSGADLETSNPK